MFHIFSNYDCNLFFKKRPDKKNDKVKFHIIPQTNGQYMSVAYGCIRFIDSYRFLSLELDEIVRNLDKEHFKFWKKNFLINGKIYMKTWLPIWNF